jgi:hypothetical protein
VDLGQQLSLSDPELFGGPAQSDLGWFGAVLPDAPSDGVQLGTHLTGMEAELVCEYGDRFFPLAVAALVLHAADPDRY